MSFGAVVRKLRTEQKLTLEGLAERTGLTPPYLSTIETDKRDPSISTLRAIAQGLGVSASDLLEEEVGTTTPRAQQVARLFDAAPAEVQEGVYLILKASSRKAKK